jgi:hypothetical protein
LPRPVKERVTLQITLMCDQMNSASFRTLFPFLESSLGWVQTYGRYFRNKSILRERKLNEPKFHTTHKIQNGETYMFWAGITYMFKTCFLCKLYQWGVHYMHLHLKTLPYGHHSPKTYKLFFFFLCSFTIN